MSTCIICDKTFRSDISLIQHTEQVHGRTGVYNGVRCWESSRNQSGYLTTCVEENEYIYQVDYSQYDSEDDCWNCAMCYKTFQDKHGLVQHLSSGVHEHHRYECNDCHKQFPTLRGLKQHIDATGHAPRESRLIRVLLDDAQQQPLQMLTNGVAPTRFEATLYFDGSAQPNPGAGGCGAHLVDERKHILFSGGRSVKTTSYFGDVTNNQAEYDGLILGLEQAIKEGIKRLLVLGDSELVINQMNGEYACRSDRLISSYNRAKGLMQYFQKVEFKHIEREENSIADRLADDHREYC